MNASKSFPEEFATIYNGNPWYGKSICQVLKDIKTETAFTRPMGKTHSIAELLAHIISWRQVLINRLEKNGQPKPKQKETFMPGFYGDKEETIWQTMKEILDRQHQQITRLLTEALEEEKGKRLPFRLINGVIQHDIYHLGQIAMLKKEIN